jgi:hypothetical protein
MTIYQVNEVFREANPTVTLVDRSTAPEFRRIKKELNEGGRIVRLHGPSKSGKTILCFQALRNKHPILLYGSNIERKDQFWDLVSQATGVPAAEASAYCAAKGRPLIIEDFHWIDKTVQSALIRSFKPLLDAGGTVILISVPDVAKVFLDRARGSAKEDAVLGDLLAKSVPVASPLWTDSEIREIGTKGFQALKIRLPTGVMTVLTRFSLKNPLLMQKHCSELCFSMDIEQTLPKFRDLSPTKEQLADIFALVASQNGSFFDDVIQGSGKRPFKLRTEKDVNLSTLLLFAISWVGINQKVGMQRVLKRVREASAKESPIPDKEAIKKAFQAMIAAMRKAGQSGLVMDENEYLYIAHPFFKTYLLWKLIPSCGGELPDLDRDIDAEE